MKTQNKDTLLVSDEIKHNIDIEAISMPIQKDSLEGYEYIPVQELYAYIKFFDEFSCLCQIAEYSITNCKIEISMFIDSQAELANISGNDICSIQILMNVDLQKAMQGDLSFGHVLSELTFEKDEPKPFLHYKGYSQSIRMNKPIITLTFMLDS
jgi:hypothetical protein